MTRYRFSLQRTLWQSARGKRVEKVVVIEAIDLAQARQLIYKIYPNWDVSMFWPM